MRTGAFRYLFFAFLLLLTDFAPGMPDWTPDLVGAAILLLGLRELRCFDREAGTSFGQAAPWAWSVFALDVVRTALLFLPAAKSALRWLSAGKLLCSAIAAWICGAGVFHLAVSSEQYSLAAALRKSTITACVCGVCAALSRLLAAGFGEEPSAESSWIILGASLCSAVWYGVQFLRARKLLRPFFG